MSGIARDGKALRKKATSLDKNGGVGFQKLNFAHEASAGETQINLLNLNPPSGISGLVETSPSILLEAKLAFRPNSLTLISSKSGILIPFVSYRIQTSSIITLNFSADAGEIFYGVIDPVPLIGSSLGIANREPVTVTLSDGETEVAVPEYTVNRYPSRQIGEITVYRNGMRQRRNVGNATASPSETSGNYEEVLPPSGNISKTVKFNTPASGQDDQVDIEFNRAQVEKLESSQQAAIESLAGQVDAMIPELATLASVPETNFQGSPNNVDTLNFGQRVLTLEKILDAQIPIFSNLGLLATVFNWGTSTNSFRYWRHGRFLIAQGELILDGTGISGNPILDIPASLGVTIDTSIPGLAASGSNSRDSLPSRLAVVVSGGGSSPYMGHLHTRNTTSMWLMNEDVAETRRGFMTTTTPIAFAVGDEIGIWYRIPITEWSETESIADQLGL